MYKVTMASLTNKQKVVLRVKMKKDGKRIPSWLKVKKIPPTDNEKAAKKKAKEMADLKKQQEAAKKRKAAKPKRSLTDISKGGTKKKKVTKEKKPKLSPAEQAIKDLKDKPYTYIKKTKKVKK